MVSGLNSEAYTPEQLIAGEYPRAHRLVTITGGAALAAGSVLGRIVAPGAVTFTADAGNTGDGVLSGQAAAAGCQIGAYRVVCIEPGANVGKLDGAVAEGRERGLDEGEGEGLAGCRALGQQRDEADAQTGQ